MKLLNGIIVLGLVFFLACANGKTQPSNYKSVSEKKLRGQIEHVFSPDSSYVLSYVEQKGTSQMPQNNIRYIVIDMSNDEVVLENSIDNGNVSFYSDTQLKVFMIPGIMREDQDRDDFTYIYNLKTGEKHTLTELKK